MFKEQFTHDGEGRPAQLLQMQPESTRDTLREAIIAIPDLDQTTFVFHEILSLETK